MDLHMEHSQRTIGFKRDTPCQHLIQHNSKRIDIGAMICLIAARLFRRHISGRPAHRTGGCLGSRIHDAHQPKVCDHGFGVFCQRSVQRDLLGLVVQDNVARLDIAMNNALPVGVIERGGYSLRRRAT